MYYIIFAFLVVGIFWLLEIAVLDSLYAESKKHNCYDTAEYIENSISEYDSFKLENDVVELREKFRNIESDNEMSVWLVRKNDNNLTDSHKLK